MTRVVQIPPSNVPFLRPDGTVNASWLRVLEVLLARAGGYDGVGVTAGLGIDVSANDDGTAEVGMETIAGVAGVHASPSSVTLNNRGQVVAIS